MTKKTVILDSSDARMIEAGTQALADGADLEDWALDEAQPGRIYFKTENCRGTERVHGHVWREAGKPGTERRRARLKLLPR